MWADLIERILSLIVAFLIGVMGGCLVGGRGQVDGPNIDQETTATQTTVQAAPDSVVNIDRPASSSPSASP